MACFGNWICFKCRVSTRKETWRGVTAAYPEKIGMTDDEVMCRMCNEHMRFIGPTIQVPPKSKLKEWKQLEDEIIVLRLELQKRKDKQNVGRRHVLEKRIQELRSRPENASRNRLIKEHEQAIEKLT